MASLHEEDQFHNSTHERVWRRGQIFVGTSKGTPHWGRYKQWTGDEGPDTSWNPVQLAWNPT